MTWSEFLEEELPNIDDHDEKRESAKDNHYLCSNRIKLRFKLRQIKSGVPDTVIPIRSTMPFRSIGSIGTVVGAFGTPLRKMGSFCPPELGLTPKNF